MGLACRQVWKQGHRGGGDVGLGAAAAIAGRPFAMLREAVDAPTAIAVLMPRDPVERGGNGSLAGLGAAVAAEHRFACGRIATRPEAAPFAAGTSAAAAGGAQTRPAHERSRSDTADRQSIH